MENIQTPRLKLLLASAHAIATELGHRYVGTEHVLLALFRMQDGVGKQMLVASEASEYKAREAMFGILDPQKKLRDQITELTARIEELEGKPFIKDTSIPPHGPS